MRTLLASTVLLGVSLSIACGSDSTDPTTASPFAVASVWAATRINGAALPYDWVLSLVDSNGVAVDSFVVRFHAIEFSLGAALATCQVYQRIEIEGLGQNEATDSCNATYEGGILSIEGFGSSGLTVPAGSELEGVITGAGNAATSFTLQVPAYQDAGVSQPALSIVFTRQ